MKLLFDNNLAVKLSQIIQPLFPGSKHVFELNLADFPDREIWQYAKENNFSIVTKDRDFYYLSGTLGHPPKIIWLMIGNCKNQVVIDTLLKNTGEIEEFLLSTKDILILQ
ncbi:MAG: DUF5615 family PIN-like protein [Chitinophagaceae bacterium]